MECYSSAALRHYADAERLALDARFDNAGHLIGLAAECAIKTAFSTPVNENVKTHLPALAGIALKNLQGRKQAVSALRVLLEATKDGYFHDWRVIARYEADGHVDVSTYGKWKRLADRTLGAVGLRR